MTNKKRKQEAIKKAYGELYDYISNHIDLDGWCICTKKIGYHWKKSGLNQDNLEFRGLDVEDFSWRPKPLTNIETNNGWIRIEEDGSNLPSQDCYARVIAKINPEKPFMIPFYAESKNFENDYAAFDFVEISHYYIPFIDEPLPIY